MSYVRLIDRGDGPTKLFVGGVHGNEGETTIKFLKSLDINDFSEGKILIYNFDNTPYISTLKKEYYKSKIGYEIINLIKKYDPDFYVELHCYNIKNYEKLISPSRRQSQGVPPLIELENHILISSVSPLIRKKYFKKEAICKTLEIPCLNNKQYDNLKINLSKLYLKIIKIIAKAKNRKEFEDIMLKSYPDQVKLAKDYAKEIFGEDYPPF